MESACLVKLWRYPNPDCRGGGRGELGSISRLVTTVSRCMKRFLTRVFICENDVSTQSHAYLDLGFQNFSLIALSLHMQECGVPFQMAHTNALSYFTRSLHVKHLWDYISPISILYSFERNGSVTFYTFFFDEICMT